MPDYIIHKDGAYNLYTTVADGACFTHALTRQQLEQYYREQYGEHGMRDLPERLKRAHETGCSGYGYTLEDCLTCNRAGPREGHMTVAKFIEKYLTLPTV